MKRDIALIDSGLLPVPEPMDKSFCKGKAAVLVPIVERDNDLYLLLTKRAVHLRQHGGEVAFPGGMWEDGDQFPVATALREAREEIALDSRLVDVLGVLPSLPTRNNTAVTPVIAMTNAPLELVANPGEIESIFFVPLGELAPSKRIRTDVFLHRKALLWAPAYEFDGFEIWGFTAGVIKILLERCFAQTFEREHSAPEKMW